jgi:hypothetical protein
MVVAALACQGHVLPNVFPASGELVQMLDAHPARVVGIAPLPRGEVHLRTTPDALRPVAFPQPLDSDVLVDPAIAIHANTTPVLDAMAHLPHLLGIG